ncbi:uncharacterized protein LOC112501996 [Cynara cardunculus var. scolymus]|uniref:uncharacterized protein LOC112501996 n=1 Tax=Cynara cardunculus var. scolymus TaxID=59895 RepID=UPI000D62B7BD|nr:uncharacterized protein LOC112501996 [Cynara cardunculus var. scolymus]
MASNEPNPPKQSPLHLVYIVANIQIKIQVLDETKVTYNSWVKLFKLHARGYKVLHHIDGTPPPAKTGTTYESWAEIDAIVLQWLYGNLSDDLLVRVLDTDTIVYKAWHHLQEILNISSPTSPCNRCLPLDEYCQKLNDLVDQLSDVESSVAENRLVLQLVRDLPPEYDTVVPVIN